MKKTFFTLCLMLVTVAAGAQSELYPQHFDLEEVTLLDGPFKTAMERNDSLLLRYDVNRLLTPFIRQAGLSDMSGSKYYGWTTTYPSFENWGLSTWSLEGHVGGHYLTALSLAYASAEDSAMRRALKGRLDSMLLVLKDCQDAYADNTTGLKGFIGGQPINQVWTGLYSGSYANFVTYGGWVPFYCQHKVLAGLRDAWIYTASEVAKELFRGLCDWSVLVVSNLTDTQLQYVLGWEHGGMNELLADAYKLFGEEKYLTAAKRYSHKTMLDGMQTLSTTFLDGLHANTQVPKYIGFERVYQTNAENTTYRAAAHNFWQDVAENRTVCIGGNSVSEHFLAKDKGSQYINNLDGPESCNSNNMLKLSEILFDETHDARYADFYENTMWNHILSTQDPSTGGYVYFTTLRPQGYRIYSQVNQAMWCCVGTGMENHGKYGHFIYTHSVADDTLFINLFTASKLESDNFAVTQRTDYPYNDTTVITVDKGGSFTLAIRHPWWTTSDYNVKVNGTAVETDAVAGEAGYVKVTREWSEGDEVTVVLPMTLSYEECPNYTDYIAFKYGPILLAAETTARSESDAAATGLTYEALQNEYAGEGRMDHAPGSRAKSLSLSSSPLLIGERDSVLSRVSAADAPLTFLIDASSSQSKGGWDTLRLVPFYTIHHARYMCYWYQQTEEGYAESDMGKADAEAEALSDRTIDFVAPGEQQSEAGHIAAYSSSSSTGTYSGESYRDTGYDLSGYVQYTLQNPDLLSDSISVMCRFTTADKERCAAIYIDGTLIDTTAITGSEAGADDKGFINVEFPVADSLMKNADGSVKSEVVFKITPYSSKIMPGLYYLRLLSGYPPSAYRFVSTDWTTGDIWRVSASSFSYDTDANTITVNAGTGQNNVCLTLDYANTDYNVTAEQEYLLVRGSGLNHGSNQSFLWWLNGINRGTSVPPDYDATDDATGDAVIAWKLADSGISDNCTGSLWSISTGATIFGLTATTGTAVIKGINFVGSVSDYLAALTPIGAVSRAADILTVYDLTGRRVKEPSRGVFIIDGKKKGVR